MSQEDSLVALARKRVSATPTPVPTDWSGTWYNQLNSRMDLTVDVATRAVSGTYYSSRSANDTPTEGKITGFVEKDIISFVVDWNKYESMTAWVGQLLDDGAGEYLHTLWHLVMNIPETDEKEDGWSDVLAGSDRFSRTAPPIPTPTPVPVPKASAT